MTSRTYYTLDGFPVDPRHAGGSGVTHQAGQLLHQSHAARYNPGMHAGRTRLLLAVILLVASCALLAWVFWPMGETVVTLPIDPGSLWMSLDG